MTIGEVLARLKGVRKSGGNTWSAPCPAHDDSTPSLSVAEGREGRVLLTCHGGCDRRAVVEAMGLEWHDLFDESVRGSSPANPRTVAEYAYHDEHGAHLFDVVRLDPKGFRQRAASGKWSMDGVRRVPYRLAPLLKAVKAGRMVFIVEGEKDADALIGRGLVATTNPGGAGKWRAEYNTHLAGARVVILPDNDDVGREHGYDVARQLVGVASEVRIVALPDVPAKGDVSDWLGAGGTVDTLKKLVGGAAVLSPETMPPVPVAVIESADVASDGAVNLDPLPTLDRAAFVGPIGDYVRSLQGMTEAAPPVLLVSMLTGFGAMVGRGPHHLIDGQRHGVNLFTVVFGATAIGRKSTALGQMHRLLETVDAEFWKGPDSRVLGGFGSGESLVTRLAPPAPKDGTPAPAYVDTRLLIEEGELGALLTIKGRDGNTMSHTLRALWDGGAVSNITKHDRATVTEHHVALIGAITADELQALLSKGDARSGFANRMLFLYSARADVIPLPPPPDRHRIEQTARALRRALDEARTLDDVPLEEEAVRWWTDYYRSDAERIGDGGMSESMNARRLPILRRLALLYCVADCRRAVAVGDLEAARAIVEYSRASVALKFADGRALAPDARKLLDALTAAGQAGISRGRWAAEVFGSNSTPRDRLDEAAKELQARGLAFPLREAATGGRPREVWRLVRYAAAMGWGHAPTIRHGEDRKEGGEGEEAPPESPLSPLIPLSSLPSHVKMGPATPAHRPMARARF
ncbi:MAG: YfjI family protein [Gemmatimonadaceae bacterium]